MLFDSKREKQRWIIFAILLFLVFDFSVLALNYWLSRKIEKEAVAINMAGRQRMLSQRLVNSLLSMELGVQRSKNPQTYLTDLQTTFKLFDDTLQAFHQKHPTYDSNNQVIYLEPLQSQADLALLKEADRLWRPYRAHILALLSNPPNHQSDQLSTAVNYALENNLQLLGLMDQLTFNLQDMTRKQSERIRTYQSLAFLLALANFFGIFFMYTQRIRKVSRSGRMLHSIINKVTVSVLIIDSENRIIDSNQTAQTLFQYEKDEMIGKDLGQLLEEQESKVTAKRKDGSQLIAEVERNHVKLDKEYATILTITDITEQRMTEVRLNEMAYHDTLTGLPNRILFDDRLSLEIHRTKRSNSMLAVMFIDLDNFKPINDTYGHHAGDQLLKEIAVRIRLCLRETDTVSRRGGDEFTIILSGINDMADSEKIAANILQELSIPFLVENRHIMTGASIGISLYPLHGKTSGQLLLKADTAMYQAKAAGGNQISMFTENPAKTD